MDSSLPSREGWEGGLDYALWTMNYGLCTLNVGGRLMNLGEPRVMGILNLTPDSFYAESRAETAEQVEQRCLQILAEEADIIDVGACSTRPGAVPASEADEMARLEAGLRVVRRVAPEAVVSVDTFRSAVARRCVEEYGVQMVNDISGGAADPDMFETVARLGVPYVLTYCEPVREDLLTEALQFFGSSVRRLHALGVRDIVLDPGFGFGKTLEDNYRLMNRLQELAVLGLPMLVGVSRKSMIWRLLDCTPQDALGGTTALNMLALSKGASILRVHDVRAAVETVKIWNEVASF